MKKALFGGLGIVVMAFSTPLLAQTNGTWTNATSNSAWSTTTNWSGGFVADGVDAIADITANRTVNLGASRSIGTLDHLTGYIHVREPFVQNLTIPGSDWRTLIRPVRHIDEKASLTQLLTLFLEKQEIAALVDGPQNQITG